MTEPRPAHHTACCDYHFLVGADDRPDRSAPTKSAFARAQSTIREGVSGRQSVVWCAEPESSAGGLTLDRSVRPLRRKRAACEAFRMSLARVFTGLWPAQNRRSPP